MLQIQNSVTIEPVNELLIAGVVLLSASCLMLSVGILVMSGFSIVGSDCWSQSESSSGPATHGLVSFFLMWLNNTVIVLQEYVG